MSGSSEEVKLATALSTGPRKNPPHHDQLSVEQAVLGERPAVKGEDLEAVRAQDIQSGVSALQVHRRIPRGSRWAAAHASVRERRSGERPGGATRLGFHN